MRRGARQGRRRQMRGALEERGRLRRQARPPARASAMPPTPRPTTNSRSGRDEAPWRVARATATVGSLDADVDALTDDVITNTIISPNVDDTQFTTISPHARPRRSPTRALTLDADLLVQHAVPLLREARHREQARHVLPGRRRVLGPATCGSSARSTRTSIRPAPTIRTTPRPASATSPTRTTRSRTGTSSSCRTARATSTSATSQQLLRRRRHPQHATRAGTMRASAEKFAREHFVNSRRDLRHRLERRRLRRVLQRAAPPRRVARLGLQRARRRRQRHHHPGLPADQLPELELRGASADQHPGRRRVDRGSAPASRRTPRRSPTTSPTPRGRTTRAPTTAAPAARRASTTSC